MIYFRITVHGKRSEFSTGRKIYPNTWDATNTKVLGFSQDVRLLNVHLRKIRNDLYQHAKKPKDLPKLKEFLSDSILEKGNR